MQQAHSQEALETELGGPGPRSNPPVETGVLDGTRGPCPKTPGLCYKCITLVRAVPECAGLRSDIRMLPNSDFIVGELEGEDVAVVPAKICSGITIYKALLYVLYA